MRYAFPLLLALAACKVVPASPDAPAGTAAQDAAPAALGDTVRVALGQAASFDNGRLSVTFEAVEQDSRCPADVVCVSAGDAEARFRLRVGERVAGTTLHIHGEPKQVEYFGYRVALATVDPYPGTYDRSKPAPGAVAGIVVTR